VRYAALSRKRARRRRCMRADALQATTRVPRSVHRSRYNGRRRR
jgi:hypothetical protein